MTTASIDRRELVLALRAVRAQSDGQVQAVEPRAFEAPLSNATRLRDWAFAQGGLERRAATRRPSTMRPVAATCLFFALLLGLQRAAPSATFPPSPLVSASSAARTGPLENRSMKFAKSLVVASSALLASGGALAQDAVQWRVEDGGNGHWYGVIREALGFDAPTAAAKATSLGAHLFTGCSAEFDHAVESSGALDPAGWMAWGGHLLGPWIGLSNSDGGFVWSDDSDCNFDRWDTSALQPDSSGEDAVMLYSMTTAVGSRCHDVDSSRLTRSALIEWSSDCNSDGLVDYGQIRVGELEDTNANNIPDCCEQAVPCDPCAADVDQSGVVSGVDLAAVLGAWGTSGGKYPRADINGDGVVDGADLAAVLNGWGPCP
jgi:hypothetical protein